METVENMNYVDRRTVGIAEDMTLAGKRAVE